MSVERYREIIPDWERFREVAATPEPPAFRLRRCRGEPEAVVRSLEERGFRLEEVEGAPGVRRVVDEPCPVGQTPEHWHGLLYVQQAVMALPPRALEVRPGDRVLDLCAAPGGKTAHLAELVDEASPVVAVDRSEKRIRGLLGNLYRLGHPNVVTVAADGRALPGGALFDRVLVDAPCTGEGNLRGRRGEPGDPGRGFRQRIAGVQEALLRRAVELVRPGGTVVYATCTFAPEENEAVVSRVLADAPVSVEPIPLDAPHAPGLEAFGGRSFPGELGDAWRVYPHHLDSGGLFMARLRKEGEAPATLPGWTPVPEVFPGRETPPDEARERIEAGLRRLEDAFGVAGSLLREHGWIERGKSVWMHACDGWPIGAWEAAGGGRRVRGAPPRRARGGAGVAGEGGAEARGAEGAGPAPRGGAGDRGRRGGGDVIPRNGKVPPAIPGSEAVPGPRPPAVVPEIVTELRLTLRALRRRPVFTATTVATAALGVGAVTAVFSVVRGVLLTPLPYRAPDELVAVWEDHSRSGGLERFSVSSPNYRDFREERGIFREMGAQLPAGFNLTGRGRPEVLRGLEVDRGFFPVLGRRAALGRVLVAADHAEGANPTVVLSHALWRTRFGGDSAVVGAAVRLNGVPHEVVGVMPEDFRTPRILRDVVGDAELWAPLDLPEAWRNGRSASVLQVVGRLADGVTLDEVRERMDAVARSLEAAHPATNRDVRATVVPLHAQLVGDVRPTLLLLLGAVGLLLLIATANLAGLLLARGGSRLRELSIRTALGAGRARLLRHVVAETVVLSALGGTLGVGIAVFGVDALLALAPGDLPRSATVGVDHGVLLFALAVTAGVGMASGLLPGIRMTRDEPRTVLSRTASGRVAPGPTARGPAVVIQLALALALLSGTGLMVRSVLSLHRIDPGFRTDGVVAFALGLPEARYDGPEERLAFYDELFRRFEALPGVEAVGGTSRLPLDPAYGWAQVRFEGRPDPGGEPPVVGARVVSSGYFDALGVPLAEGRLPDRRDGADAPPVVVVNRRMARRFWPGESPLGRRITLGTGGSGPPTWVEVVGVVGDVAHEELPDPPIPEIYLPMRQNPPTGTRIVVRGAGEARSILPALRGELRALDPGQPITGVETMEERVAGSTETSRFLLILLGIFAGAALFLACLGVYGVVAHSVSVRRRELGVRIALGAEPGNLVRLVVRRGGRLVAGGLAGGAVLSLAGGRLLSGHLHGVAAGDPVALVSAAVVLGATGLLAGWLPARRALALDPAEVLREE